MRYEGQFDRRRSADLLYERAFEAHWDDVFRLSLTWTNDWAAAEDMAHRAG
jgi:hypothetical protein